ncbi:hypothetical protein IKQ26_06885 [bacterium]|nr:hypothetical protein [bacterium]
MKLIIKRLLLIFIILLCSFSEAQTLEGGVVLSDRVPKELFGVWKINAVCTQSTNRDYFDSTSVDIWIFSKIEDRILLTNPMSGATASIGVNEVNGNRVKFEKRTDLPDELSIETPILTIDQDTFEGVDRIYIKTTKHGALVKEDFIEYKVKGTKMSGTSLSEIFGRY